MYDTHRVRYFSSNALQEEFDRNFEGYLTDSEGSDECDDEERKSTDKGKDKDKEGDKEEEDCAGSDKAPLARLTEIVNLIYNAAPLVTKALAPILIKACGSHWEALERDHSHAFEQLRLSNVHFCNDLLKGCLNHTNSAED